MQNNVYVKSLHMFNVTIYKKCKFEKIHLMLIIVDNDFVIYNRYAWEFLLLESRNSKNNEIFQTEPCLPLRRISLEFYITKQIAYLQLKVYNFF